MKPWKKTLLKFAGYAVLGLATGLIREINRDSKEVRGTKHDNAVDHASYRRN